MASILDQFGIKEVMDVTIYDLVTGKPVLYFDTLKVSTVEQQAQQSEARGGKGNPPLLIWDYGKEITVTLQDALFSPKSLSVLLSTGAIKSETRTIHRTVNFVATATTKPTTITINGKTYTPTSIDVLDEDGETQTTLVVGTKYLLDCSFSATTVDVIEISANTFPGTYKLVGDTFVRNKDTGVDEFFQFSIAQAKMSASTTITLQAEGDPSVFDFNMRVLRPTTGNMMELVKYNLTSA